MTTTHDYFGSPVLSLFADSLVLESREETLLFAVLDGVARSIGRRAGGRALRARLVSAGAAFRAQLEEVAPSSPSQSGTRCHRRRVSSSAVLDLAAELLELADLLVERGLALEAMALEGTEGRLLEGLAGSGPHEGTQAR